MFAQSKETPEARRRRVILEHVRSLDNRLTDLPDSYEKTSALAELAGRLCRHDRAEARRLFLAAGEALRHLKDTPAPGPIFNNPVARDRLLSAARSCDAGIADEVIAATQEQPSSEALRKSEALLESALHLDHSAAKIPELAGAALEAGGADLRAFGRSCTAAASAHWRRARSAVSRGSRSIVTSR